MHISGLKNTYFPKICPNYSDTNDKCIKLLKNRRTIIEKNTYGIEYKNEHSLYYL